MSHETFLQDLSFWGCLWQSTMFIALGLLGGYFLRHRPSRAYQLLLFAMIGASFVPLMSAVVKHNNLGVFTAKAPEVSLIGISEEPIASSSEQAGGLSDFAVPLAAPMAPSDSIFNGTRAAERRIPWRAVAAYGWIIATLALFARLFVTFVYGSYLVRNSQPSGCEKIQQAVDNVALKLGLFSGLEVRSSSRVRSPVVWCWSHPSILLVPTSGGESRLDWSGVVAHELAHRKRLDHITGFIAELIVCMLPWNPLIWLSKRYLIRLGEQACNDWVVATSQPSEDYAESLLRFRPQKQMAFLPAVVHSNKGLAGRVNRILKDSCANPRAGAKWALASGFVILCLILGVAFAQTHSGSAISAGVPDTQLNPSNKLHRAASAGDVQIEQVRSLIAGGADVNARDAKGRTPLHQAVLSYTQSIGVVELLIENNVDVNAKDNDGRTPIDIAMDRNRHKTFALIMSKGGNVSLHTAAFAGDLQAVNNFIKQDVDINAKDSNGKAALHYATGRGHMAVIKALLANGAKIDAKDKDGDTALHHAAGWSHREVIALLLEKGADPNSRNANGNTPVEIHITRRPNRRIVDLFVKNGATTSNIYVAAYLGDLATVKDLIEKNKSAAITVVNGSTPLHTASWAGNTFVAEFLINNGANVNARDEAELTPLAYAAMGGHKDIVKLMIDRGANLKTDYTGVECALMGRQNEILKILLAAGSDAKILGDKGSLHLAGMRNNLEAAKLLIRHGVDVDAKWLNRTALYHAVTDGRVEFCKFLIAEGANVNARSKGDWTPLHAACAYNLKDKVELFLSAGADVNARNSDGKTPMDLAVERGHTEIVEILRKHRVKDDSPQASSTMQLTRSLRTAVTDGGIERVKLLIAQGADVNAQYRDGQTLLHRAISYEDEQLAELLIANGASGNIADNSGLNGLHWAVLMNMTKLSKLVIEKGADIETSDNNGWTPLHHAADSGSTEMVSLLLEKGANINAKNKYGENPLDIAAMGYGASVAELLVFSGAEVNTLHAAALIGDEKTINRLISSGKDINSRNSANGTPLHAAACGGNLEVVRLLLKNGADVDAITKDNTTPLNCAAFAGHEKIAKILIEAGAKVEGNVNRRWTPLQDAARGGHRDVAELLIAHGADISAKNKFGSTPLRLATAIGHREMVELLISKGANVNVSDNYGWRPLHWAAQGGYVNIAEILISHSADLNPKKYDGGTPIHSAAEKGQKATLELLIAKGADVNAKNNEGKTPLDLAETRGHKEIVELLKKHGAKE